MFRIIYVTIKIVALAIFIGLIYVLTITEIPEVLRDLGIAIASCLALWLGYCIVHNLIQYYRSKKGDSRL